MKKILISILLALFFITVIADQPIKPVKNVQSIIDEDFFKQELQNSVMEFITDTGMNPDSCYIPFKDEL